MTSAIEPFRIAVAQRELAELRARLDAARWPDEEPDPAATPLVLTHGWPGSFLEFEQTLAPLAEPAAHGGTAGDAFHVVVPSLPGYAFSGRPATRRWAQRRFTSIVHWSEPGRGGHFGAWEQPELFVRDIRATVRAARGLA